MSFPYPSVFRWSAACVLFVAVAALSPPRPAGAQKEQRPEKLWVYIGTYTGKTSKGIYRFELDPATGKLSSRALAAETVNPSFLAIHPNQRFLYAVNEIGKFNGKKSGAVIAFAIDPKTGDLTLLNQQPSGGAAP